MTTPRYQRTTPPRDVAATARVAAALLERLATQSAAAADLLRRAAALFRDGQALSATLAELIVDALAGTPPEPPAPRKRPPTPGVNP